MPHPHAPAQPWPDPPEHVRPLGPDSREAKAGVLWCIRCGRVLWSARRGDHAAKPCIRLQIELRVLSAPGAPTE